MADRCSSFVYDFSNLRACLFCVRSSAVVATHIFDGFPSLRQSLRTSLILALRALNNLNKAEALAMDNHDQIDSSNPGAALEGTTLGVNPTQYYRPEPRLGFTPFAELWHGRLAMVGIVLALAFELITHHM